MKWSFQEEDALCKTVFFGKFRPEMNGQLKQKDAGKDQTTNDNVNGNIAEPKANYIIFMATINTEHNLLLSTAHLN